MASLVVAWSTLAVGGAHVWASVPTALLGLALVVQLRPRVAHRPDVRPLDVALAVALAAVTMQVLPLPNRVRWFLSPQVDVDRFTLLLMPDSASPWRPLSLDPAATLLALLLVGAAVSVFWSCRHLCGRGYATILADTVALVGLTGAVAAIVQRAAAPTRIYGLWLPVDQGALPFGPFVNRNHFATWLLMAVPLTAGAIAASVHASGRAPRAGAQVAAGLRAMGSRRGWTVVALVVMVLTLVLSSSRSALGAGAVALGLWCVLGFRRTTRTGLAAGLVLAALLAISVAWTASPQPLVARVQETLALGTAGRSAIWQDASTVAQAYPTTGTGLGTFERAMLIYQTGDRRTRTNQAHSQYLQLRAEGGTLLTLPVALVAVAFVWCVARRLREDASPSVWLRIGASSGVLGVAVQSVWETGLRMPANGMLLAVVAAIAVHRPTRPSP